MREFYNFSRYILKWRLLFLIVNLLVIELSFGQDPEAPYINEYIKNSNIASPDIREFEKRSFLSGNLNKGQINVNIPIYTIEQGNITYPISLIYNTGGIKIDQRASNVGLGWALSHTFITREIIGGNDFNDYGNRNDIDPNIRTKEMIAKNLNDVGKVGYFMQKANNVKLKYDGDASIDRVDFFPDIYHLSSPLFKTRFYLKDLQTPIELDYQQSKISFQPPSYKTYKYSELFTNHPFKDIFKFEIVSDKGIKYTFNEYTINYSDVLSWGTGEHTLPQVSSWLITEIYDYSSGLAPY